MTDGTEHPNLIYAKHQLDDLASRVRFQHEFALAGFRTLILINGGAIIALLTYLGNFTESKAAHALGAAFISYVAGLVSTTLAYVFAYFSQGAFLSASGTSAETFLGLSQDAEVAQKEITKDYNRGYLCVYSAVVLTVLGLIGFVAGSWCAMHALT